MPYNKKKFNIYKLREWMDDFFFEVHNLLTILRYIYCLLKEPKIFSLLISNKEIKNNILGQKVFIITSGPSLKKIDLSRLKGENIITVNKTFLHPLFAELKPLYHIINDNKLITGDWDLDWLYQIKKLSPETTIVLNARWILNKKLRDYLFNQEIKCRFTFSELFPTRFGFFSNWYDITKISVSLGVVGSALVLSVYLGAKKIIILGKDSNGLAYEILKQESHFYGVNSEANLKEPKDFNIDLFISQSSNRMWRNISYYCRKRSIKVFNSFPLGLVDAFEGITYEESLEI